MTDLKQKIKRLIFSLDFIPKKEKQEWLLLIKTLDEEKLNTVYKHFKNAGKKEEDFMMDLLIKDGRGEELVENIEEISKKSKREAIEKEEKYVTEKGEQPEDILKKLKDL